MNESDPDHWIVGRQSKLPYHKYDCVLNEISNHSVSRVDFTQIKIKIHVYDHATVCVFAITFWVYHD